MTYPASKTELRKASLSKRKAVAESTREAFAERMAIEGVQIARRAFVRTIAAYWPIGSEADTRALLTALAYHEFITCLPVTPPKGNPLIFRCWTNGQPMVEGPMDLLEPAPTLREITPDLLFVPLAAFDRRGYRIGYGGGYYDRTLAHLRATHPGPAIGLAFACQEIERVPEEDHDQPLDMILTENELIDCALAWK